METRLLTLKYSNEAKNASVETCNYMEAFQSTK